ncbi:MAG: DUF5010 domain-containing protein [Candidatus Hinthialibacter antarcticus]|nr:DUF5010 domain-containing protein [Candidatus Hinthialibacter antarcticus]
MRLVNVFLCVFAVTISASSQDFRPAWSPGEIAQRSSYSLEQKIVGTHYFYWYDYPKHHFYQDAAQTVDILQDHFVKPESVSYRDAAWHAEQLDDCADAGLDFILPVYWGTPDNYFKPDVSFSVEGLAPLQLAADRRIQERKQPIKIGLFYDTSTLLPSTRGELNRTEKYDLRTNVGKDIFYRTIRDFYFQIHPRHWATVEGKPLVVLYGAAFSKNHDATLYDYVYENFERDFHGVRPYIIRDMSWAQGSDATTQWGAALSGPYFFDNVVQIGAGYNDSAVPGRSTPIRKRENGNFYRWGWEKILDNSANIVLIETWNEMHEGTSICESREYGSQYIELTSEYVKRFKKGDSGNQRFSLKYPDPVPRPPSQQGSEFANEDTVSIRLGSPIEEKGIWLVRGQTDGPVKRARYADEYCIKTVEAANGYMYFSIADPFAYDVKTPIQVKYTYYDDGFVWHALEYDSHDSSATLNGAYKMAVRVECTQTKKWVTREISLEDARFVNRENGAADFRFAVGGGSFALQSVFVMK